MEEYSETEVIVVGAGSAGIGVSVLLKKLNLDFIILEKDDIGSSFIKWPKETQLISPSFTGNFFQMVDLNAITPDTSPATTLLTEHPTGEDYAAYLKVVAHFHQLPIQKQTEVKKVKKTQESFMLTTNAGAYKSKYLIWAAGEYQYPNKDAFGGSDLCVHYSEISSFADLDGDERIVIGAYESGFDAAINLINEGKKATLLDEFNYLEHVESDSSYCLSPFTRDRIHRVISQLHYHEATRVTGVEYKKGKYIVNTDGDASFTSLHQPINCTGFDSSLILVNDLFHFKGGFPMLNQKDESIQTENLFLVGPQVKHQNALFCFIYKYRQRFAIVAETIAKRKRVSRRLINQVLRDYKDLNFYLDDLSCCDNDCVC